MRRVNLVLLDRVRNLGGVGDQVTVRSGFAWNYLLPNKLALLGTPENLAYFETRRTHLEQQTQQAKEKAEKSAPEITDKPLILIRQASSLGQLYGSVSPRDIALELEARNFPVKRQNILLSKPIKSTGVHEVSIALHADVVVTLKVLIAQSLEEAEIFQKGPQAEDTTSVSFTDTPAADEDKEIADEESTVVIPIEDKVPDSE